MNFSVAVFSSLETCVVPYINNYEFIHVDSVGQW